MSFVVICKVPFVLLFILPFMDAPCRCKLHPPAYSGHPVPQRRIGFVNKTYVCSSAEKIPQFLYCHQVPTFANERGNSSASWFPWSLQSPAHTQITTGFKGHQETPGLIPPYVYLSQAISWSRSRKSCWRNLIHTPIWVTCYIAFFGFIRVSKFTVPNKTDYDKSCHLCFSDIAVDNRKNPHLLKVIKNWSI